ncbi:MAG: PQQ-binding-like beta-propeller repeat protein [Novosphingobium sp.]|nr:PQQ-binding-like beta-propeller repeat protein [Novosphingobium sp.]
MRNSGWHMMAGAALAALCTSGALAQEGGIGLKAAAQPLELHKPAPVDPAALANPPADDWLSFRRTVNGWGYSPLTQIDPQNVKGLKLAWSRPLAEGSYEGTPLVHDGVMYIIEPGDVVEAVDAATGDFIWKYQRQYPEGFRGGPGSSKRNSALFENLLIASSPDGFVYALDIATGKQVWETKVTDWKTQAASTSGGPIIAGDKVISGRNCAAEAGPDACVIVANDARTGKELWRVHTIVKPGEPGDDSWGGVPWSKRTQVGTWMPPTYDPELNLIYYGTSVTAPTPKYLLGGNDKQHLYSTSTLAIDANTGKIVWHYQHLIDHWDFDHTFERLLVDTEVAPDPASVRWINPKIVPGEKRKVLTGIPGKTGIVYTLDRQTGEFLWATPTVRQTVVQSIDGATGNVTDNPAAVFTGPGQTLEICPSFAGGKNWMEGTYSPRTGLMYMPLQNICETVATPKSGGGALGMGITNVAHLPEGETNVGTIRAISVATGKTAWQLDQRAGMMSLLSTGGGVVFAGDAVGRFKALDDTTGQKLWEVNLASPVGGYPISYAADGKQYVAVGTGLSPEAFSLAGLTPEYKVAMANVLYVFTLPEK